MVVMIALSIGLHEVGHLLFAKLFRVRVPKFMIGFGPTLFSRKKGETEYGIKAIPLGGFIAMIGMYPPNPEQKPAQTDPDQAHASPDEPGPAAPVTVSRYDDGQRHAPELVQHGSGRSGGMFRQLAYDARAQAHEEIGPGDENRVFYKLPVWKRLLIMLGGPVMNLVIAVVILGILVSTVGVSRPSTTVQAVSECVQAQDAAGTECGPEDPAAPAAKAGLRAGDKIVAYNGAGVNSWDELTAAITTTAGTRNSIEYIRDGEQHETTIEPIATERALTNAFGAPKRKWDGSVQTGEVGFIGIVSQTEHATAAPTEAIPMVGQQIGAVASIIVVLPQMLIHTVNTTLAGEERDPNGPISIVGVGRIAGEISALEEVTLSDRVASLLSLTGGLNVALFVFNMIPLLPLDGGHIVGALWEGLRRRVAKFFGKKDPGPFDAAKLLPLTYVAFGLLTLMGITLILADVINPVKLF
ncbi:M50 family metallopeptidase [Micrococcoides hystricis]|uniref:RIP metalloprotease n=1 Tax=Micrococcoides hystricis TaxID=1572761 RepID=A0ABV6P8P8_9MICC